ncbi:NAD(P)(+) transhydrogenase (Re/Si-specific) subunit beta, partial [Xanthomonas sacchari]
MLSLLVELSGFAAALLFILGLKRMSSPVTALRGIVLAGIGMLVAVAAAFGYLADLQPAARPHALTNLALALLALLLGGAWAWRSGRRVAV